MILYKLTLEQKDLLIGQQFAPSSCFNPVQDVNGDWFITGQEIGSCVNSDFQWVITLPAMEYIPPPSPENRQQKVDLITSYMKSQLTDSEFIIFIQYARDYLIDYTYYSDTFYYWVETTNNQYWGDFTQNGFKTKTSYRGDVVDGVYPRDEYILSILNPSI
jgi:hypothetical protein